MDLEEKKALSLLHNDFEDLEFWYPSYRLQEAGMTVDVAAPEAGKTYIGKYGVPAEANLAFGDVDPSAYEVLLVPGGWAPDKLRRYREVLDMVTTMHKAGKVIGEICHAGWVLISADILSGRTVTSTPGIRDDMRNAGATWVNEPVVTDGNLVSSRRPPDLPAYMKELIRVLSER